jgi:cellulose synthase/poly-beta-1,6-N-acetylglucosamine synthase-like glycosyltransferase
VIDPELLDYFAIFVQWINCVVLAFLAIQCLIHFFQLIASFLEVKNYYRRTAPIDSWRLLTGKVNLPISVLVPAYDEETTIVDSIHSLLSLHYPDFEIIVINDGSADNTLKTIIESFDLNRIVRAHQLQVGHQKIRGVYGTAKHPNLIVLDKENGGKADALNAGINFSRCDLICTVDADSIVDPKGLLLAVRPFIEEPTRMIAVGSRIRIVNGCKVKTGRVIEEGVSRRFLSIFQTIEYIRAFLIDRPFWNHIAAMTIISGAFGLFRRSAVIDVGGYSHNTVGEDMELVVKLHRHYMRKRIPYKMEYVPDIICWTEAPVSLKVLRRQRSRWQRGLMQTLFKHRKMILAPNYGAAGMLGMSYQFFFYAISPIIELIGYIVIPIAWVTDLLNTQFFIFYIVLVFLYGLFFSIMGFFWEEFSNKYKTKVSDLVFLSIGGFLENFGYRQLNTLWRLEGLYQFLTRQTKWGSMPRVGFEQPAQEQDGL